MLNGVLMCNDATSRENPKAVCDRATAPIYLFVWMRGHGVVAGGTCGCATEASDKSGCDNIPAHRNSPREARRPTAWASAIG
jgi:hypothetical protein